MSAAMETIRMATANGRSDAGKTSTDADLCALLSSFSDSSSLYG
jgi:hypothetical protein